MNSYIKQALKDQLVFNKNKMDEAEFYRAGPRIVAVYTNSSPDSEKPNEDKVAILPTGEDSLILIAADGLGGHATGDIASSIAIKEIQSALKLIDDNSNGYREAILSGIENANQSIMEKTSGSATIIAVAEVHNHSAHISRW